MDLHEEYHKETVRMPAVLLGIASAAIGFAFHETADRVASPSLLPLLAAVLCWGGSFAAGVLFSRAYALGMKANIGLNVAEQAGNPQWVQQAKSMFDENNRSAARRYAAQQWLLLFGAGLYLAGHIWHVTTIAPTALPEKTVVEQTSGVRTRQAVDQLKPLAGAKSGNSRQHAKVTAGE